MTTKPKAKRFRIKRPGGTPPTASAPAREAKAPPPTQEEVVQRATASLQPDDAPEAPAPKPAPETARAGKVASPAEVAGENTIDAIRREGLTGRQLRMARRVAQKHGLAPTSDFDAVRLLRDKGIDPFQRSNMLELVVPSATGAQSHATPATTQGDSARVQLPQTVPAGRETLPSTELSPAQRRESEIGNIQRDIAQRRRRKMLLLLTRLSFFVFLPTLLAGYYFFVIATPMYATNSEFLIQQNEGSGTGVGGLLAGTQFATSDEAISIQGFLTSKEAMLKLDEDQGFRQHFAREDIDAIQRLEANSTIEEAYKTYQRNIKIGFDPTEGVVRMEVAAADPETSARFAESLIGYAEARVNDLSAQRRSDQMRDAENQVEKAQADRRNAQEALVRLQLEGATLDPEGVIAGLRAQINQVELQVIEKELELASLLNNARPNAARVSAARGEIENLKNQLTKLNQRMTDASQGENSLANLSTRIQLAQADIATRDLMLQTALQAREQARTEASRQVRYLTVSVRPIAPEEPAYPRAFENTILAFLIFAGIYLMISLTASILREQVTS